MFDLFTFNGICLSATAFCLMNKKLVHYLKPHLIGDDEYLCWKWRNILISLFHSLFVGFGVLYIIIFDPSFKSNMIKAFGYSAFGNVFICISTGYFIYDLLLSLFNLQYPGRIEIIVHHIISLSCLIVSLSQRRFHAHCLIGLTVEINNVFIHLRQLLTLSGVSPVNKIYCINSIIAIVSLLGFRFVPLSWITYCIYLDKERIELPFIIMAVLCLTVIFIVSCVLFFRIITADFNLSATKDLVQLIGINSDKFQYECSSKLRKIL